MCGGGGGAADRLPGEAVPPRPRSRALHPGVGHWLRGRGPGIGDTTLHVLGGHRGHRWGRHLAGVGGGLT